MFWIFFLPQNLYLVPIQIFPATDLFISCVIKIDNFKMKPTFALQYEEKCNIELKTSRKI